MNLLSFVPKKNEELRYMRRRVVQTSRLTNLGAYVHQALLTAPLPRRQPFGWLLHWTLSGDYSVFMENSLHHKVVSTISMCIVASRSWSNNITSDALWYWSEDPRRNPLLRYPRVRVG
jgi:hypothetical protein